MPLQMNPKVIADSICWANDLGRSLMMLVIGTRPCYIKFASLIGSLKELNVPFLIIESGQHYDTSLTSPKREFGYSELVGASLNARGTLTEIASGIFEGVNQLADVLCPTKSQPVPIPVVSGDTATAGFFPQAWYLRTGARSIHVEAGLRSYGPRDWNALADYRDLGRQRGVDWALMREDPFPEALCSRLASQTSATFFAPLQRNRDELLREGFDPDQIHVVGSLSADAVTLPLVDSEGEVPKHCKSGKWVRVDLHRRENMTFSRLKALLGGVELLIRNGQNTTLVLSNTLKAALDRLDLWDDVKRIEKVGGVVEESWTSYRSVIEFMQSDNCAAIYTDSGGLQEEACILNAPCFTCRFGSDRPETILDFDANLIVPPISSEMVAFGIMSNLKKRHRPPRDAVRRLSEPYGKAVGSKIASILNQDRHAM
jgi:UDP-N-acetylglucosamine 2-epimerase